MLIDTRSAVLALPSGKAVKVLCLIATVAGVFFFPFVFNAFGRRDNPFDAPIELVWIVLLAFGFFAALLIMSIVRRGVSRGLRNLNAKAACGDGLVRRVP